MFLWCDLGATGENVFLGVIKFLVTVPQVATEKEVVHHLIASPESSSYKSFICCTWLRKRQKKRKTTWCVFVQGDVLNPGWMGRHPPVVFVCIQKRCFVLVLFLLFQREQSSFSRKTQRGERVTTLGGNNLELSRFHKCAVSDPKHRTHLFCCCASFLVLLLKVNECLEPSWATLWVSYECIAKNLMYCSQKHHTVKKYICIYVW